MTTRTLIRIAQVEAMVGLKRSRIQELIRERTFPRQVKLGFASAWVLDEVQAWIDARIAERDLAA